MNIALPAIIVLAVLMASCAGGDVTPASRPGAGVTEGWVDSDTFRVRATGAAPRRYNRVEIEKSAARTAAAGAAQKRFVEIITKIIIDRAPMRVDYMTLGWQIKKEFAPLAQGGSIIDEAFDESHSCTIVYEVGIKTSDAGLKIILTFMMTGNPTPRRGRRCAGEHTRTGAIRLFLMPVP